MTAVERYTREIERYCRGDTPFEVLRVRIARDIDSDPAAEAAYAEGAVALLRRGRLTPQRYLAVRSALEKLARGIDTLESLSADTPEPREPPTEPREDDPTVALISAEDDEPTVYESRRPAPVSGSAAPIAEGDETTVLLGTPPSRPKRERRRAKRAETAVRVAPGTVLKQRFVLEEMIGKGGMGVVYRALDLRKKEANDRTPYVAVKVLNDSFKDHPEALMAFQREARKAQDLAHPNIVNVYDFDRDGNVIFMVMELLDGEPLNRVIKNMGDTRLPRRRALEIIDALGQALIHAHSRGVVHADFKPSNCFVTHGGEIKVLDFGIARAYTATPRAEDDATLFDPATLGALTPAYASREMLEGRDPDPRDDVYAFAVVAYSLLAGAHPFDRKSAVAAQEEGIAPARPPGLTRAQWRGLQAGLSLDRRRRTPTVRKLVEDLTQPPKSVRLAVAGVLVAAVAGGAVLAYQPLDTWLTERRLRADAEAVRAGERSRLPAVIEHLIEVPESIRGPLLEDLRPEIAEYLQLRVRQSLSAFYRAADAGAALDEMRGALRDAGRAITLLSGWYPNEPALPRWRDSLAFALSQLIGELLDRGDPIPVDVVHADLERLADLDGVGFAGNRDTFVGILEKRIRRNAGTADEPALRAAGAALFPEAGFGSAGSGPSS